MPLSAAAFVCITVRQVQLKDDEGGDEGQGRGRGCVAAAAKHESIMSCYVITLQILCRSLQICSLCTLRDPASGLVFGPDWN